MKTHCIFCNIIAGTIPSAQVFSDEKFLVIKDIAPKAPVHFLIMPKIHVQDMNDESLLVEGYGDALFKLIHLLSAGYAKNKAFNLISNNGAAAGQSVFHVHWHFLAGKNLWEEGLKL